MKIAIITSAPDMIENCIESTILRKAVESKNVEIYIVDIRDFSDSNYKQIDDWRGRRYGAYGWPAH